MNWCDRFLLKYATRDEVELFKTGSGSVAEVKDAVGQYEDKSPLYGLVLYRRKRVLLKYLPDGTSRLLQGMMGSYCTDHHSKTNVPLPARLAVHFQSIIDKFPHDVIISFTNPFELTDNCFSSSLALPKLSNSIKSSNSSLERQRLTEIAEDVEDPVREGALIDQKQASGVKPKTPAKEQSDVSRSIGGIAGVGTLPSGLEDAKGGGREQRNSPAKNNGTTRNLDKSLPATPTDSTHERTKAPDPISKDPLENSTSPNRRTSSQSVRPSTQDLYSAYRSRGPPGPRPSLEYARGHSSGSYTRSNEPRPVSTLPAGLRMPQRNAMLERPQTHHTPRPPRFDNSRMPPLPSTKQAMSAAVSERPASRAGSTTSVTTYATHTPNYAESKSSTATPEKMRLMKALQMRKKQMEKRISQERAASQPSMKSVDLPITHALLHGDAVENDHDVPSTAENIDYMPPGEKDVRVTSVPEQDTYRITTLDEVLTNTSPAQSVEHVSQKSPALQAEGPQEPADSNKDLGSARLEMEKPDLGQAPVATETRSDDADKKSLSNEHHGKPRAEPSQHGTSLSLPPPATTVHVPLPQEEAPYAPLPPHEVPLPVMSEDEKYLLQTNPESTDIESKEPSPEEELVPSNASLASQSPQADRGSVQGITMTRPSTTESIDTQYLERKAKRRGLVDPLRIIPNSELSDEDSLSGDSFMQELQSATVQQAKPISVSRSPATSAFPNSPIFFGKRLSGVAPILIRTKSAPPDRELSSDHEVSSQELSSTSHETQRGEQHSAKAISARSAANPLEKATSESPQHLSPTSPQSVISRRPLSLSPTPGSSPDLTQGTMSKKMGVSSLISQRIRALEKFSSPGSQPASSSPTITPSLVSVRQPSFSTPPGTSSSLETPSNGRRRSKKDAPYPTPSPSPHANATLVRPSSKEDGSIGARSESVSVTATIVRDASNQNPDRPLNPSEPATMALHHSPLQVHHENPASSKTPKKSSRPKVSSVKSSSASNPETRRDILASPRRESLISRRSSSSRKSLETTLPLSPSSSDGQASIDGMREEKKESRSSRLFKRMSLISSASRRTIAQALAPSVKEEPIVERHEPTVAAASPPPAAVDLGELNIQFPDTLVRLLTFTYCNC